MIWPSIKLEMGHCLVIIQVSHCWKVESPTSVKPKPVKMKLLFFLFALFALFFGQQLTSGMALEGDVLSNLRPEDVQGK